MLLDKPLSAIKTEDVLALVGERENARLEFKRQPWGVADKHELLKDISSMANADGGCIVIGAEETCGVCTGFAHVDGPLTAIQAIRQTCLDGIQERLPVQCKSVALPTGSTVILIYIEAGAQRPYLISRDGRNEFWKRHDAETRKMSLDEVRQAVLRTFADTYSSLVRAELKDLIQETLLGGRPDADTSGEAQDIEGPSGLSQITHWRALLSTAERLFKNTVAGDRAFRLVTMPETPDPGLMRLGEENFKHLLRQPPGQRHGGWNMESSRNLESYSWGVRRGHPGSRQLLVLRNGLIEFSTAVDTNFCWRQTEEAFNRQPEVYPYPVTEYPVSFLRLASAIYQCAGYHGPARWQMQYWNVRGVVLKPYAPNQAGYEFPGDLRPFEEPHFSCTSELPPDFDPDVQAFASILELYRDFGHSREEIPFFDETGHFTLIPKP